MVARSAACEAAAYAFTVGRNVGLAYLPTDLGPTDDVQVEVFGRAVAATVGEDVLVGARLARVTTLEEILPLVEVWRGRELNVSDLSGGLTNTNHLVETDGVRYVVRIPGASTELLAVDRTNERHNAAAASATGVSPRIVEVLEDLDVMVIEYIDGTTMSAEALRTPEQGPSDRGVAPPVARRTTLPAGLRHVPAHRLLPRRVLGTRDPHPGRFPRASRRCCEDRTHLGPAAASDGAVPQRSPRRELHRRR